MFVFKNISILILLVFISHSSFALGETLSKMADDVGESVSKIADSAVDLTKQAGHEAGIGATAKEIDQDSDAAIAKLFKQTPKAAELYKNAKGVLIFPKILKAGLGIGGHHGKGALREGGKTVGYYNTVAASYGLQIGGQSFGYVMFFMDDEALKYLKESEGWEVGVGPSVVLVDEGMAKTMTTTSTKDSVYVFIFNQKGLMAGMGIQGSKITRIHPE